MRGTKLITILGVAVLILAAPASANSILFEEGFEGGLQDTVWDTWWNNSDNQSQRDVHIDTDNPHSGDNSLYMSGADWEGGSFGMLTAESWSENSVMIDRWFRSFALEEGTGGDGVIGVNLYNDAGESIGAVAQEFGRNLAVYTPLTGWLSTDTSIEFLDGWHELSIEYMSEVSSSSIDVYVDDTVVYDLSVADLGAFGRFGFAATGQYYNRAAWNVDDISISAPVPEPASISLLGLGLAGMVLRRSRRR